MVRFVRLLAVAALAASPALVTPAAKAQTGLEEGAVQTTGPLGAPPQKAKSRQTALKKRATACGSGRAGRSPCTPVRPG